MKVWASLSVLRAEHGRFACCRYCANFAGDWCELRGEAQIEDGICLAWEEAKNETATEPELTRWPLTR